MFDSIARNYLDASYQQYQQTYNKGDRYYGFRYS